MRPRRVLKAFLFAFCLVGGLWAFIPPWGAEPDLSLEENIIQRAKQPRDRHVESGANESNDVEKNISTNRLAARLPEDALRNTSTKLHFEPPSDLSKQRLTQTELLKQAMLSVNHEQTIYNRERFRRGESSIVLLVMVHDRLEYLEYLISSLRKADGIGDALLIFSHDYYSDDINRVIRQINFCQTMQIFYPYSPQVYPNEFPGHDPKDCPRDASQYRAKELKCNNWEHPDSYGHYREVTYVMTKHHWFWKLQHVFSGLDVTKDHKGLVVLMEEDHYVAPDFYPMLKKMYQLKNEKCPECDILTLGNYDKNFIYKDRNDKVDILNWQSSKHNMGMSIDRKTWEKLQTCVETFCTYDDYNWDWTMNYISYKCLPSPLQVMVFKSPRIFHIGSCGIHHKGKGEGRCSAEDLVHQIDSTLSNNAASLFPSSLSLTPKTRPLKVRMPKANGGWGDVRDHALCMSYGKGTKRLLL